MKLINTMRKALLMTAVLTILGCAGLPVTSARAAVSETPKNEQTMTSELRIKSSQSKLLGYTGGLECVVKKKTNGHDPLVVIAIDGTLWAPGRSIACQTCLADQEMMFVRCETGRETDSVLGTDKLRSEIYAELIMDEFKTEFPEAETLILYVYSKGGWYLNDLYREAKSRGYGIGFVWCNDACPSYTDYWCGGRLPNGLGFPDVEADRIATYVAYSRKTDNTVPGKGTISGATYDYGHSKRPDNVVFCQGYTCRHNQMGAASAEDFAKAISEYRDSVSGII